MAYESKKVPPVYMLFRPSRCYSCDQKLAAGQIVQLKSGQDEREVLCINCAKLTEFVFLPKGDANSTRLAGKYSKERYVVFKWSELWKCYERQGLLIEKQAAEQIEAETKKVKS